MIDLTGIYNGLLEQWDQFPSISRAQFTNGIESRGIATAAEADAYVESFAQAALDLALLDVADWDTLQARVAAVGLVRAISASRNIHERVLTFPAYRINLLEVEIAAIDARVEIETRLQTNGTQGRAWLVANGPSGSLKDDTLTVIDRGLGNVGAVIELGDREKTKRLEEIARLGG